MKPNRFKHTASASRGHSLVESLVALSIISMVAGTAALAYTRRMPAYQIDQAALKIVHTLRLARSLAVLENIDTRFTLDVSSDTLSIWVDRNRNGTAESGEKESVTVDDVAGLYMWVHPAASGSFDSRGNYYNNSEDGVHLIHMNSPDGGHREVYVFQNGHVDVKQ